MVCFAVYCLVETLKCVNCACTRQKVCKQIKIFFFVNIFYCKYKLSYILSILLYASNVWFSNWPNCRKLEKMRRRALKWALNKKFFTDSDYYQSLIYNNLLPISFLLVRNDLLMLNKIYNCDTALKFDDYWKVFKGPRSNRSAENQFLRTNFNWTKSVKLEEYCLESCVICKCSHPAK